MGNDGGAPGGAGTDAAADPAPAPDTAPPGPAPGPAPGGGWRSRLRDVSVLSLLVTIVGVPIALAGLVVGILQLQEARDGPRSTSPGGELSIGAVRIDHAAGTIVVRGSVTDASVRTVYAVAQMGSGASRTIASAGAEVDDRGSWSTVIDLGGASMDDTCCEVTAGYFDQVTASPTTTTDVATTEPDLTTTTESEPTCDDPVTGGGPGTGTTAGPAIESEPGYRVHEIDAGGDGAAVTVTPMGGWRASVSVGACEAVGERPDEPVTLEEVEPGRQRLVIRSVSGAGTYAISVSRHQVDEAPPVGEPPSDLPVEECIEEQAPDCRFDVEAAWEG